MRRAALLAGLVPLAVGVACTTGGDVSVAPADEPAASEPEPTDDGEMAESVPAEPMLEVGIGDVVRYGDAPQQFAELVLPDPAVHGDGPHPVIVFIHGGFWRNAFDLSLAQPQAADARSAGYATWNIEYRRVGDPGGGYPGTLDDVGTAVDALARVDAPVDLDRVAVVGHSAGGHLALWVGQRDDPVVVPRLVIGQAPVADLGNSLELGRGAVIDFMGGTPAEIPEAYDAADPARRLPIRVPQLILQGSVDDIVPPAFVEPYAAIAGADIIVFDGVDHFDVIDPENRSWGAALRAIDDALEASVPSE
ncbi:MAG: alpha/beta hydrolase [Actinomycetota bacterium]